MLLLNKSLNKSWDPGWPAQLSCGETALDSIYCLKVRASNLMPPFYLYHLTDFSQVFCSPLQ